MAVHPVLRWSAKIGERVSVGCFFFGSPPDWVRRLKLGQIVVVRGKDKCRRGKVVMKGRLFRVEFK